MLEQMRHAGLAVVLVTRADEIGDVHCRLRLARIRKQQHLETVPQRVFGDAFNRRSLLDTLRKHRGGDAGGDEKRNGSERASEPVTKTEHVEPWEAEWRRRKVSDDRLSAS